MVPDMSAEQYPIAQRKAIYLPESDCILLYAAWNAAWITNKELQSTILLPELLDVDTTGDTNTEDLMLMIVAGLENVRRKFPSIRACLPSKCQWVMCIKQVTHIKLYAIVTQLIQYICTNITQFIFECIHC
jgi:hypothetical protein